MVQRSAVAQRAISQINRADILRQIRDQGETTRFELASRLQLSHTTVKTYIESLLAEGLIEVAGTAKSMGGRKPLVIRLVPDARFSLGVNFAPGRIDLLLLNLRRDELERRQIVFDMNQDFADILENLALEIDCLLKDRQIDRARNLGIGMAFPGLVDDSQDMLVYLANLGVRNFSLKPFEARIGLPVFAENEAQAAANAERILGKARGKSNLVYISIAEGIGAGIIINSEIYRSNGKNAGEFGHVRISDEPVRCNCGRTGCWEQFASGAALLRRYAALSGRQKVSLAELFSAYRQHEPAALLALEKYTRDLFKGIDIILLAFSPEDVIIGGDLADYADDVIELGVHRLGLTSHFLGYENTRFYAPALRGNAAVLGAALLPLENEVFFGEGSATGSIREGMV